MSNKFMEKQGESRETRPARKVERAGPCGNERSRGGRQSACFFAPASILFMRVDEDLPTIIDPLLIRPALRHCRLGPAGLYTVRPC
jgi:hypothetical protein